MSQLKYLMDSYPIRLKRLLKHFIFPFSKNKSNPFPPHNIGSWIVDLVFYIIDIVGCPEVYTFMTKCFKWNTRKLNTSELNLAKKVFGDSVNYEIIRIDDSTKIGTKKLAHAYVSFNIINYNGHIDDDIFIHEMVHIWQYQRYGMIYIPRAISAQRSKEGYDYGGVNKLYKSMLQNKALTSFNFEQQADIIEHYYVVHHETSFAAEMTKATFAYFARQLHDPVG